VDNSTTYPQFPQGVCQKARSGKSYPQLLMSYPQDQGSYPQVIRISMHRIADKPIYNHRALPKSNRWSLFGDDQLRRMNW